MSDYIKREAALDTVKRTSGDYAAAWAEIAHMAAADVAPVRHGRWIPTDYTGDCCYTCSECGFERDAYLLDVGNYCPNCGARMDKEANT